MGFLVSSTCWGALISLGFEPQTFCSHELSCQVSIGSFQSGHTRIGLWCTNMCVWVCCQYCCVFWCYHSNRVLNLFSLWLSLPFLFTQSVYLSHTFSLSLLILYALSHDLFCSLATDKKKNTTDIRLTFLFIVIWFSDRDLCRMPGY